MWPLISVTGMVGVIRGCIMVHRVHVTLESRAMIWSSATTMIVAHAAYSGSHSNWNMPVSSALRINYKKHTNIPRWRGNVWSRHLLYTEFFKWVPLIFPSYFARMFIRDTEADVYVKNHYISSNLHAMLICYVVASKPQRKLLADHDITRPSRGFNCVSSRYLRTIGH